MTERDKPSAMTQVSASVLQELLAMDEEINGSTTVDSDHKNILKSQVES